MLQVTRCLLFIDTAIFYFVTLLPCWQLSIKQKKAFTVCHDFCRHQKSMEGILEVGYIGHCPTGERPHNPATWFHPPTTTVVSPESFLHRSRALRGLYKDLAPYRHWSVFLWWDPNDVPHRWIILPSYQAERWSVSASLCWWCCCYCLADQLWILTHIRYMRRRIKQLCLCLRWSYPIQTQRNPAHSSSSGACVVGRRTASTNVWNYRRRRSRTKLKCSWATWRRAAMNSSSSRWLYCLKTWKDSSPKCPLCVMWDVVELYTLTHCIYVSIIYYYYYFFKPSDKNTRRWNKNLKILHSCWNEHSTRWCSNIKLSFSKTTLKCWTKTEIRWLLLLFFIYFIIIIIINLLL